MGNNKLKRFAEMKAFANVMEPSFDEVIRKDYLLKGKWSSAYFKNDHPVIIELGCGKAEYTLGMANMFPGMNFIGIDRKGARMWRGAKTALGLNLTNVCFLRTRIEFLASFFGKDEISEIWITFPDPHPLKSDLKHRLTSPRFLGMYSRILLPGGTINLKTDSIELYEYTLGILTASNIRIYQSMNDIYSQEQPDPVLNIRTFYEHQHLAAGKKICYLKFANPAGLLLP
ncbi:MAG: tRNA (guanosine(46)-N7)-methyltransferase TrmB [Bacteroidia bacterium]|nr:tRNA (guanosine(46)-N7)-methyltransferase TrmB [Bacteroidia bacterium]